MHSRLSASSRLISISTLADLSPDFLRTSFYIERSLPELWGILGSPPPHTFCQKLLAPSPKPVYTVTITTEERGSIYRLQGAVCPAALSRACLENALAGHQTKEGGASKWENGQKTSAKCLLSQKATLPTKNS